MSLFSYVGEMSVNDLERERNGLLEGIRKAKEDVGYTRRAQIVLDAAQARLDQIERELKRRRSL